MKSEPVVPARVEFIDGVPFAPDFGDIYHSRIGAFEQARHVFLGGNGLPGRWAGHQRFVVLETGFGLGNNFLATWAAWRDDPQRCERLWFISIDRHPPTREDLARAHAASPEPALAASLVAAWPPLTPDLHSLEFEGGRVTLLLAFGDVAAWSRALVAEVDAFYLDGFAPSRNPQMWTASVMKALARLARPGATAVTWSAAHDVRDALSGAGFAVERAAGFGDKRDMTVATFAPRFMPRRPPGRAVAVPAGDAIVIGSGLAGASVAWALARQGVACRVLEGLSAPAQGTSGNLAGLFHGTVHADDGPHARFNRSAALEAARLLGPLAAEGRVGGQASGVLRLESVLDLATMQARLRALGLPSEWVQALDASAASALAGLPLRKPAWFYPGGGWIDPGALARHWLGSDPAIRLETSAAAVALRRAGARWEALDAAGRVLASGDVAVVAAGLGSSSLLGDGPWPLTSVRGQVTVLPAAACPAPRLPVAGAGYALALRDGRVLCGATSQPGDPDPSVRDIDHRHNLARLQGITGCVADTAAISGRVGWRVVAPDRLPVVGAVPQADAGSPHPDRVQLVTRAPGLFVHAALGSRGIAWAALGARVIAAAVTGAPAPLDRSLLDAIDPARFAVRRVRKSSS